MFNIVSIYIYKYIYYIEHYIIYTYENNIYYTLFGVVSWDEGTSLAGWFTI